MMNQVYGNKLQVESLMNTVFEQICIFADEDGQAYKAYEVNEVDDNSAMLRWDTENLTSNAICMLNTVLWYRLQDKVLSDSLQFDTAIEKPMDNHIRITTDVNKYETMIEDYCIYNNVPEEQYAALVYPLSLTMNVNKAEIVMVNLTDEMMDKISRQGKTQVKANAIHKKVDKIGTALHTTSKVVMKDVVNPLAVNAAKISGTVASGLATTAVDCGLAVANEVLRDAAKFSLNELKNRDEVQTMKYSIGKILNKHNKPQAKNSTNSFSL